MKVRLLALALSCATLQTAFAADALNAAQQQAAALCKFDVTFQHAATIKYLQKETLADQQKQLAEAGKNGLSKDLQTKYRRMLDQIYKDKPTDPMGYALGKFSSCVKKLPVSFVQDRANTCYVVAQMADGLVSLRHDQKDQAAATAAVDQMMTGAPNTPNTRTMREMLTATVTQMYKVPVEKSEDVALTTYLGCMELATTAAASSASTPGTSATSTPASSTPSASPTPATPSPAPLMTPTSK